MLVSLQKNNWLYDWISDNWKSELTELMTKEDPYVKRPTNIKKDLAQLLAAKGYKTKVTGKGDIIISMTEEEYVFLKLKYS